MSDKQPKQPTQTTWTNGNVQTSTAKAVVRKPKR